jgi:hypothetical protein
MTNEVSDIRMDVDNPLGVINDIPIKRISSSLEEFLENPIEFLPRDEDINLYIEVILFIF